MNSVDTPATIPHKRCVCGKLLRVDELVVRRHSGVRNYAEALCLDCRQSFARHARVVCLRCDKLQGFLEPCTDKVTGFEMKPGGHYHIDGCPSCSGKLRTPILEHEAFCKAMNIPTRVDLDLLQEVEQKNLQTETEADRLVRAVRAQFDL